MEHKMDIMCYLNKYRLRYILIIFICVSGVVYFSIFKPRPYVSTTVVLLSVENSQAAFQSSIGKFLGLSGYSGDTMKDVIISMIQSNRMGNDITRRFNLDKTSAPGYKVNVSEVMGGLSINVYGPDPKLTRDIANFVVEDLDKINIELSITASKPIVKVLDVAENGLPQSRNILRNLLVAFLIYFFIVGTHIFILNNENRHE
ncbi:MAG: hypothetical protein COS29_01095 [Candidatus Omnitrophica bacterium CG02_land_8_20_14_3_00__42_8]|nr:MAG: hypothetical protein COS29_01095 [Candidatus Omnitrophica bacterium CG02_land_8_20_14_3_00__42_8]